MSTDRAVALLTELGLPIGDSADRPSSDQTFPGGGHYRIEIPSVEGFEAASAAVDQASRLEVPLHRLSSGSGIMLLSDAELKDLAELGSDRGIEICPFVGPRAPWEGSGQVLSADGRVVGYRHSGMDQVLYALRDVERAVSFGLRSVLLADEGLIDIVARGRASGHFPDDLIIKGSALMGIGNAAGLRVLEQLGLDTMNVPCDLTLDKLASVRSTVGLAIDLYIESPDGLGGFLRYHEISEIVRVASPIHLKFGLRNAAALYPSGRHLAALAESSTRERVNRAAVGIEHLNRAGTSATPSSIDPARPGVPRP
jgi:hypothetical protein